MRLPADHDEVAGEVAEQNVVLDLRILCGTGHAEAHVPVRGSVERAPCCLNARLPDTHVAAAVFSGATVAHLEKTGRFMLIVDRSESFRVKEDCCKAS